MILKITNGMTNFSSYQLILLEWCRVRKKKAQKKYSHEIYTLEDFQLEFLFYEYKCTYVMYTCLSEGFICAKITQTTT